MQFIPIASSSLGNAYLLKGGRQTLLIEAGIPFKRLQKALDYRVSSLAGCLISHSHQDHAKAVKDVLNKGVYCYMLESTRQELELNHHRIRIINPKEQFKIGEFVILPFDCVHDVPSVGFLIQDSEGKKFLYATDTAYIRYTFKGLNIIAIECNYSKEILINNILKEDVPVEIKRRLERSHFSLENVKEFFRANDMSTVEEIWLIHMSNANGNEELFRREIERITGVPVYIA